MSPSGTFATIIPIAKIKLRIAGYPTTKPKMKRRTPIVMAKMVSRTINLVIYCFRGASSVLDVAARLAICPMKLRSPVAITTPFPEPSLLSVPKNPRFLVSRGLTLVHSTLLTSNYVSPVSEELSTFMP